MLSASQEEGPYQHLTMLPLMVLTSSLLICRKNKTHGVRRLSRLGCVYSWPPEGTREGVTVVPVPSAYHYLFHFLCPVKSVDGVIYLISTQPSKDKRLKNPVMKQTTG